MIILKNKDTGVESPFTQEEYDALKKHPNLFNRFVEVKQEKAPTPPELEKLTKSKK